MGAMPILYSTEIIRGDACAVSCRGCYFSVCEREVFVLSTLTLINFQNTKQGRSQDFGEGGA